MKNLLLNKKAQSVMGEYVLTFFIVLAVMSTMSVYLKRAIQGRMRDAKVEMGDVIRSRAGGSYVGPLYLEYEPYYQRSSATATRTSNSMEVLSSIPGFTVDTFGKVFDETTIIQSTSQTAPPLLAD